MEKYYVCKKTSYKEKITSFVRHIRSGLHADELDLTSPVTVRS